jgi:hypothetical protein
MRRSMPNNLRHICQDPIYANLDSLINAIAYMKGMINKWQTKLRISKQIDYKYSVIILALYYYNVILICTIIMVL